MGSTIKLLCAECGKDMDTCVTSEASGMVVNVTPCNCSPADTKVLHSEIEVLKDENTILVTETGEAGRRAERHSEKVSHLRRKVEACEEEREFANVDAERYKEERDKATAHQAATLTAFNKLSAKHVGILRLLKQLHESLAPVVDNIPEELPKANNAPPIMGEDGKNG